MARQIFTPMTASKLMEEVESIEIVINAVEAIPFKKSTEWKTQFPAKPGVYFGFLDDKLSYIGETSEIRARMDDLGNTYKHTLRKKLGLTKLYFTFKSIVKDSKVTDKLENKFTKAEEKRLDEYMEKHLTIKAFALNFGRKEVEDKLVEKYEADLLNSTSVRGKKKK